MTGAIISTAKPIFVEVLDRRGHVLSRERLTALPARIGRGYDCDVIIDDPFIATEHLQISRADDDLVTVRDLHSKNGLRANGKRITDIQLHDQLTLIIGKTHLRLSASTAALAPEKLLVQERISHPAFAIAALAVAGFIVGWETWVGMVNDLKPIAIITGVLSLLGALLAWAGGWALITRLMQGVAHYPSHLFTVAMSLIGLSALIWLTDAFAFIFNLPGLTRWRVFAIAALAIWLVYSHVRIASGVGSRRMLGIVVGVGVAALGVQFLNTYQSHKQLAPNGFSNAFLPPSWRLARTKTVDDFFVRIQSQKEAVDALRALDSDRDSGYAE